MSKNRKNVINLCPFKEVFGAEFRTNVTTDLAPSQLCMYTSIVRLCETEEMLMIDK